MWYWFPNNQVFSNKKKLWKSLLFFDEEYVESKDWWVAQPHYTSTIYVRVVAAIFCRPLSLESQYLDMSPVSMKSYIYIYIYICIIKKMLDLEMSLCQVVSPNYNNFLDKIFFYLFLSNSLDKILF